MDSNAKAARREYKRAYDAKNRKRINEYHRNWSKKNPDKVAKYQERYWQKKATNK